MTKTESDHNLQYVLVCCVGFVSSYLKVLKSGFCFFYRGMWEPMV